MSTEQHAPQSPGEETRAGGVFTPRLRPFTVGILAGVGVVAFESLGVATVLPTAADDLDGLHSYGWGLSALMLANIVGTVVAGASIDRRGPARAVAVGSVTFALGCLLAGLAPSWELFILARAVQGLGAGATMAYAYSLVGLAYPPRLQAVMFAFLSSAWTIPSLIGPLFGGLVASWADWRVVFWALAPTMPLLLPLVLPTVRRLPPAIPEPLGRASSHPVLSSVLLAAGAGVFLIGLESTRAVVVVGLGAIGIATAIAALRRITPAGTLRAARGAPAGIAVRFLLCSVYFGSEAFLPLGLTSIHGLSATSAGIGLAAGALSWTAGSFLQARLDGRFPGKRAYAITLGFATLLAGEVVMGLAVALPGLWSGWAVIGWALGGAGMGVAFNAATSATMAVTPAASTGNISAALQLAQTLATALIAGFGGALIARTGATTTGFLLVFGLTAALGLIGVLLSHRSAAVAERR